MHIKQGEMRHYWLQRRDLFSSNSWTNGIKCSVTKSTCLQRTFSPPATVVAERLCFHRCLSVHPPGSRHPPGPDIPGADTHATPLRPDTPRPNPFGPDTPPKQTPPTVHARRYGQQTGGMHPTGMHICYLVSFCSWYTGHSGGFRISQRVC